MTLDNVNPLLLGAAGAGIAAAQILALAMLQAWAASRKDKRDAERKAKEILEAAVARKLEKDEDYARADEVANRVATAAQRVATVAQHAADAATLLVKAQQDTIARTDEVARLAADADARIGDKLSAIHTLVNSDMTAARTAERDALKLLVIAIRKANNLTAGEQEEITRVEKRIDELNQILVDRAAAQAQIDAHQAVSSVTEARLDQIAKSTAAIDLNTKPPVPTTPAPS